MFFSVYRALKLLIIDPILHWHEYGAYIGIMPIILLFIGIITGIKKNWPLVLTGIVCFCIVLGDRSLIKVWDFFHNFPVYNSFNVTSRFIMAVIFRININFNSIIKVKFGIACIRGDFSK